MHLVRSLLRVVLGAAAVIVLVPPGSALADVPGQTSYQGLLLDAGGLPLDDTPDVVVRIYRDPVSVAPADLIYEEAHLNTPVVGGVFEITLGQGSFPGGTFDASTFSDPDTWLEVEVDGETLAPRQRFQTVAYAFQAQACVEATRLGGQTAAEIVASAQSGLDFADIGGIAAEGQLPAGIARDAEVFGIVVSNGGAGSGLDADLLRGLSPDDIVADAQSALTFAVIGGVLADGQIPGNVTRDAEVPGIVLGADGPGSGLDADFLDGLSSSAFVQTGADFGRPGVAPDLFEGAQSLSDRYVNENQPGSISGAMIADASVTAADLAFSIDFTGPDANGGLLSLTNSSNGSSGNLPAGLLGQASGDPGIDRTFGVLGAAPGLGLGGPLLDLPAGKRYGVAGAVDAGIGTAGIADGVGGIGVYGDGTTTGVQGISVNGPTKGYLGVQGLTDFDGEADLDLAGLEIGVLGYSSGATTSDNYGLYGASNGTGVYAQGDILAGDFVGDVDVAGEVSVDRVAYNTPRVHYHAVADGDFIPRQAQSYATGVGQGGSYMTAAGTAAFIAGIHLPDGAVVTRLDAIVDDTAAGNLSVTLAGRGHAATGTVTMANVVSSGAPGITTLTDTTISAPTIDNLTTGYNVRAFSSAWPGNSTLAIKGVVVHYTISEAH